MYDNLYLHVLLLYKDKNKKFYMKNYVDLGLSVKWATCNIGANSPEEYGEYFAWGETVSKDKYKWDNYKHCKGRWNLITKYYIDNKSVNSKGDNKTILDFEDDAARILWGDNWRMPTKEEQDELRTECDWTWTTRNGVYGYKVVSKKNGNSIFLPAGGAYNCRKIYGQGTRGHYWSSNIFDFKFNNPLKNFNNLSCYLYFDSGDRSLTHRLDPDNCDINWELLDKNNTYLKMNAIDWSAYQRYSGKNIRPVYVESVNSI